MTYPLRSLTALAVMSLLPRVVEAAPGPGLGNLDCGDAEYMKPLSFIENAQGPNGTNVAIMIRGYFLTIFAPDSGAPPGEIGIYDVSNPKTPKEVRHIENGDTTSFREAHSLPWALIGGKQYVAIQTIRGMQIWDFTDPPAAVRVGRIDLPGVAGGDYENVAWQSSWQGRYLYVSGGNGGIYIIDAANPAEPKLLKQVPISVTGGFRVGPLFAVGDYMVISNMDQGGAYAVLDISDPDDPALLGQVRNLPRLYTTLVGGGDRIYAAGRDGDFLTHSFTDPTDIKQVKSAPIGQDQLYVAAQDEFVFLGRQNNFVKVDVTDEQNPRVLGEGTLGRAHPDHGQVTPFGNLVYIGNDHGTGSAFFCHQRGKDVKPPTVQSVYPKDGSTWNADTARVTIVLSDYIDTDTLTPANVVVRPVGGEPLEGIYTYGFNTVSFGPSAPLAPDTTYEIVLAKGGLHDVMGNALSEESVTRFATGESIMLPPDRPDPPAGGMGGASGSGAGASGNTGGSGSAGRGGSNVGGTSGRAGSSGNDADGSGGSGDGGCSLGAAHGTSRAAGAFGLVMLTLGLGSYRRYRRANRS